jgi:hypothetical protein
MTEASDMKPACHEQGDADTGQGRWLGVKLPHLHDSQTAGSATAAASAPDEIALPDEEAELLLLPSRDEVHHSTFQFSAQMTISNNTAALRCLYASHCLARWAWRAWEFAVVSLAFHN